MQHFLKLKKWNLFSYILIILLSQSLWEYIPMTPLIWNPVHKYIRLAPYIIHPNLQNPEICKAKQSGYSQDKEFLHCEDSFPINKIWKNIKEGMSMNHRQNYFCNVACYKNIQADVHRNSLPNYFTIIL